LARREGTAGRSPLRLLVRRHLGLGWLVGSAAVLWSAVAAADPQANLGLTVGGVLQDAFGPGPSSGAFHLGGRGDVLFLRERGDQMAIGPYVDAATSSLHDFDFGGGVEWLVPIRDDLPLVFSAGAICRHGEGHSWAPGAEGTVFFGSRSYNFHSWYGFTLGIFAQTRWVPASPAVADMVFGVQIDAELLAMPSMLIISALRN
jgi:hypothetical protein